MASNQSYDEINAPMILVLLASAAIFFGGVIVPAVMALNYHLEATMAEADIVAQPDAELTHHQLNELNRIGRYRWIDQQNQIAAIPVDRAIMLYADRQLDATKED